MNIQHIPVNNIFPHPHNPRRELGDLTSLADDIRDNGVRQPLTVIGGRMPKDITRDEYTVIMGHRRHAAATLAGRDTVPCFVVEMTPTEQLSAMLAENIQRSDLTPLEEAAGFYQLRMDMGVSVEDIAKNTGYSQSKVRQRIKIAELPADKALEAQAVGATLLDLIAVAEVEDEDDREALLKVAGTANFEWKLKDIEEKKLALEQEPIVRALLEEFAEETTSQYMNQNFGKYYHDETINLPIKKLGIKKEKYTTGYEGKVFFTVHAHRPGFTIYKERGKTMKSPQQLEQEQKNLQQSQRREQLEELTNKTQEKRDSFIRDFKCDKNNEREMTRMLQEACILAVRSADSVVCNDFLINLLGLDSETEITGMESLKAAIKEQGGVVPTWSKFCLIFAYAMLNDDNEFHAYNCAYYKNDNMSRLYELMIERLGYEMSDEEKAWMNGTHELYVKGG
jgi:ParB family chromosome partitioning protein